MRTEKKKETKKGPKKCDHVIFKKSQVPLVIHEHYVKERVVAATHHAVLRWTHLHDIQLKARSALAPLEVWQWCQIASRSCASWDYWRHGGMPSQRVNRSVTLATVWQQGWGEAYWGNKIVLAWQAVHGRLSWVALMLAESRIGEGYGVGDINIGLLPPLVFISTLPWNCWLTILCFGLILFTALPR